MKKLFAVWAVIALVLPCLASAAVVEVGSNGEVRSSGSVVEWKKTNVVIDDEVLTYRDAWKQAYAKPNTVVSVKAHTNFARDGLFSITNTQIVDVGIVYDGKHVSVVRDVMGAPEESFNAFVIFWLAAMTMMVWCVLRVRKNKETFVLAILTAIANFVASFSLAVILNEGTRLVYGAAGLTITLVITLATTLLALLLVGTDANDGKRNTSYLCSLLMMIGMGTFLLS